MTFLYDNYYFVLPLRQGGQISVRTCVGAKYDITTSCLYLRRGRAVESLSLYPSVLFYQYIHIY